MQTNTDDNGNFWIDFTNFCMEFPLANDEDIHVTIAENSDTSADTHTRYTYAFSPTSEDYASEYVLEVPDLARMTLPTTGVDYIAAGGATKSSLS